jgi:high-affinity nickel-transport protein
MVASSVSAETASRWARIRASLTPAEWRRAGLLAAIVALLHVVGFALLSLSGAIGIGVGITAYTLGLRHAFDADHIAAIDNTTRKLMSEGQRPLSVGFFFSLGHSSVVFALGLLVAAGVRGAADNGTVADVTGVFGPVVSGTFLLLIGVLNLLALMGITRVFRRMRQGSFDEAELESQLLNRGLLNRIYGRAARAVSKPWHMYPLGFLFGLGFDTATEVALLILAASAAGSGAPFWAILALPVLFAAGMSLFDTLDGAFMNFAYGWALAQPVRKIFYNLTVTALSVAVALGIGSIELFGVLTDHQLVDLNVIGYAMVALFALTWAGALAVWRFGRVEERWSARL